MTHPEPPVAGTEVETLVGSLERQRATFRWKAGGLDAAGLRATVASSTITLGGLLKHLALVEDHYFSVKLFDQPPASWVASGDWDADDDWEWTSAADDSPEELYARYDRTVERSRDLLGRALQEGGLDRTWEQAWPDGRAPSLRRTLVDLIEEYARHTGHADLLREAVDGLVGEDPPG